MSWTDEAVGVFMSDLISEQKEMQIINELGLHARAAAAFVKVANRYRSDIMVSKDSLTVNGKSIMGVLMLAAAKGASIVVEAKGDDAQDALKALAALVGDRFGESK
jgi:phosphocarrier protein